MSFTMFLTCFHQAALGFVKHRYTPLKQERKDADSSEISDVKYNNNIKPKNVLKITTLERAASNTTI